MENGLKTSQLPPGGHLQDTDLVPVARGGVNARLLGSMLQRRIHQQHLTTLTGGGPTALDGIPTVSLGQRELVILYYNNELQFWLLLPGNDAEDEMGGIIRPDDYAAITNQKVWRRVL